MEHDPGGAGIGFVSFAYTAGVNAVGYQGVACTLRNAKSGQYGGVRNFWMVTKGAPKGEAREVHRLGHEGRQQDGPLDRQLQLDRHPLTTVPAGPDHGVKRPTGRRTSAPSVRSARWPWPCSC